MTTPVSTGITTFSTPSDVEIRAERVHRAPRALVFDAYTKPEHVSQWMLGPTGMTMPVCEIDLRVGGAWRYVWRKENGFELEMSGEFREIERPARIVHVERMKGQPGESLVTTEFTEVGDGLTKVTQTMRWPSREVRDFVLETGMTDGMQRSFERLDALLAQLPRTNGS